MSERPRCYMVVSPEYEVYHQTEIEPAEYGRAVLHVRTVSAQRAKVLAVRAWRRLRRTRVDIRRKHCMGSLDWLEDGNPFRGVTTERVDEAGMRASIREYEAME